MWKPTKKMVRLYYKRARAKKIRLGACLECARNVFPGSLRCRVHILKRRKRVLCRECRRPIKNDQIPAVKAFVHDECRRPRYLAKRRASWRRRVHTPAYKRAHLRAVLKYQAKHKRRGLCPHCPRKRVKGSRYCPVHIGDGHPERA